MTRNEMLDRWRIVRYRLPPRADVTVESHGTDFNELLEAEFDSWWLHTLDTAPAEWFAVADIARAVTLDYEPLNRWVELELPLQGTVARLTKIRLQGWNTDARLVEGKSRRHRFQKNLFLKATVDNPVAVRIDRRHWRLFPASSRKAEVAEGIDSENYNCDKRCLSLMNNECV